MYTQLLPYTLTMHYPIKLISLPRGWDFDRRNKQVSIQPSLADFKAYMFAHGFVATITDTGATETLSPFQAAVILKLLFKCGCSDDEQEFSHVFARANAFSPEALLIKSYEALSVGDAAPGALRPTSSDCNSCQIKSWKPSSFTERRDGSPYSPNYDGVVFEPGVFYKRPLLGFRNIPHYGGYVSKLLIQPKKLRTIAFEAFKLAPSPEKGKGGGTVDPPTKAPPPMRPRSNTLRFFRVCDEGAYLVYPHPLPN